MNLDPLYIVNLLLCIIIVVLGYLIHKKTKSKMVVCVTIAFALFGISHLATILDIAAAYAYALIAIRITAYLAVVYGLYGELHGDR